MAWHFNAKTWFAISRERRAKTYVLRFAAAAGAVAVGRRLHGDTILCGAAL